MPYIVRVSQPMPIDGTPGDGSTVRAVATLEGAKAFVRADLWAAFNWRKGDEYAPGEARYHETAESMGESGGTVGPLPDGRTIQVEPKTWGEVADAGGWLDDHAPVITTPAERAEVLAVFNARHA